MHALQNRVAELEALLRTRPPANETAGSTRSTQTISPAMAPPAMPKRGPSLSAVSPQLVENKPPAPPRASPPGPEQDMARQNAALGASNFSDEDVEDERSFGTLIVDESGRHKWIGPRAGSEWLQEGTGEDGMATPFPAVPGQGGSDGSGDRWKEPGHAFPFTGPPALTLDECLAKVPSRSEARVLIEAYYRCVPAKVSANICFALTNETLLPATRPTIMTRSADRPLTSTSTPSTLPLRPARPPTPPTSIRTGSPSSSRS
jgi:hypothetical protein